MQRLDDLIPRRAALPRAPQAKPRSGARSVLALQHLAGNRAAAQLLRDTPKPPKTPPPDPNAIYAEAPEGVTAGPNTLPQGANLPDADSARVDKHASVGGRWTERGGKTIESGTVGEIDRILIEGLPGTQEAQGAVSGIDYSGIAQPVSPGKGPHGRAVALVPHAMRAKEGETAVLVHFHGVDVEQDMLGSAGMRDAGNDPEDVGYFQIPQQVQAFLNSRPGARLIVLMPIGTTYQNDEGKRNVSFGVGKLDGYITDCLAKLTDAGVPGLTAGPVYLSAHSGGGFTLGTMFENPKLLPSNLAGVFGFESIHGKAQQPWIDLVTTHLGNDLKALSDLAKGSGSTPSDQAAVLDAQLKYLKERGFRFAAFAGTDAYRAALRPVRAAILGWFKTNHDALAKATGGRSELLNQLWANYQANQFGDKSHMHALSFEANLGKALAETPTTGVLAPASRHGAYRAPALADLQDLR
jgi:hypothetical protein